MAVTWARVVSRSVLPLLRAVARFAALLGWRGVAGVLLLLTIVALLWLALHDPGIASTSPGGGSLLPCWSPPLCRVG